MRTLADAYIVTKSHIYKETRYFVRFFLNLAFAVSVSHERGRRFESSLSTIGTPALRKLCGFFAGVDCEAICRRYDNRTTIGFEHTKNPVSRLRDALRRMVEQGDRTARTSCACPHAPERRRSRGGKFAPHKKPLPTSRLTAAGPETTF